MRPQQLPAWTTEVRNNLTPEARLARNLAGLEAYIEDRRRRGIPPSGLRHRHRQGMSFNND